MSLVLSFMLSSLVIQLSPCYGKEKFHPTRVFMFILMIVFDLALIAYWRLEIATELETQLFGRIYLSMASLGLGFVFYGSFIPERFLVSCFGKKKSSRGIRETIQLLVPSHAIWHLGVFGNGYGLYWALYYFNLHIETVFGSNLN